MELIFDGHLDYYECFKYIPLKENNDKISNFKYSSHDYRTKVIIDSFCQKEPSMEFDIDGFIKVNLNLIYGIKLNNILEHFVSKIRYKKYSGLLPWIPMLQDLYWNNTKQIKGKLFDNRKKRAPTVKEFLSKQLLKAKPIQYKRQDPFEQEDLPERPVEPNDVDIPAPIASESTLTPSWYMNSNGSIVPVRSGLTSNTNPASTVTYTTNSLTEYSIRNAINEIISGSSQSSNNDEWR